MRFSLLTTPLLSRTEKMMRRVKEEHTRQKTINATLQSELEASRPGSEMSSRTRLVNGRLTPMSDDGHSDALRVQLADAHRQAQRGAAEKDELQKRMTSLQTDVDRLRESLIHSKRDADMRLQQIEDLETEIERLEASLHVARQGKGESLTEELTNENGILKRENELLQQRIGLLLDVDHPGGGARPISGRPASHSSSENAVAFDALSTELDDWLATSSSRPMSDYDSEPHRILAQPQRT